MTNLTLADRQEQSFLAIVNDKASKIKSQYSATYSPRQIKAIAVLDLIVGTEERIQSLADFQLMLMHFGYTQALFDALGFATFEEWLDSRGIDTSSGRLHQLKSLATMIIPWCEYNRLMVNDNPVTIWWFTRKVGGKSITARARHAVAIIREIVTSSISAQQQIEEVKTILSWLEDPQITVNMLKDGFGTGGIEPFSYQAWQINGKAYIQMALDEKQFSFLKKRLTGATKDNEIESKDAIVTDQGLAWMNPGAFVDLRKLAAPPRDKKEEGDDL